MFPFLLLFFVGIVNSVKVNLTGEWIPGYGGKVNCSWAFPADDRLQSVKLYYSDQELLVFRPEVGEYHIESGITKHDFTIDCRNIIDYDKLDRSCIVLLTPIRPPPPSSIFSCEVSGERPYFRVVRKTYHYEPFVPASMPELEAEEVLSHVSVRLNCSSFGLPAPELEWRVRNGMVTGDFTGKTWNASSSTWRVWSSITLSNLGESELEVTCTPKQKGLLDDEIVVAKFKPANSAGFTRGYLTNSLLVFLVSRFIR